MDFQEAKMGMNNAAIRLINVGLSFIFFLSLAYVTQAVASTPVNPYFKFDAAETHLKDISRAFTDSYTNKVDLRRAIDIQEIYQERAEDCVALLMKKLASITNILSDSKSISHYQKEDYKYVMHKKEQYNTYLSQCRLFLFKSNDVVIQLKENLHTLTKDTIFHRDLDIGNLFSQNFYHELSTISFKSVFEGLGLASLGYAYIFYWLLTVLILAVLLFASNKYLKLTNRMKSLWQQGFLTIKHAVFLIGMAFIISSTLIAIKVYFYWHQMTIIPPIIPLLEYTLLTLVLLILLKILFRAARGKGIIHLFFKKHNLLVVVKRGIIPLFFIISSVFITRLFARQLVPSLVSSTLKVIFDSLLILLIAWSLWPVVSRDRLKLKKGLLLLLKAVFIVILSILLLLELSGFHNLLLYLLRALSVTSCIVLVSYLLLNKLDVLYNGFIERKAVGSKKIHSILSVKTHQILYEAYLVKFSVYCSIALLAIYFVLMSWWVPAIYIDKYEVGILASVNAYSCLS